MRATHMQRSCSAAHSANRAGPLPRAFNCSRWGCSPTSVSKTGRGPESQSIAILPPSGQPNQVPLPRQTRQPAPSLNTTHGLPTGDCALVGHFSTEVDAMNPGRTRITGASGQETGPRVLLKMHATCKASATDTGTAAAAQSAPLRLCSRCQRRSLAEPASPCLRLRHRQAV